MLVAHKLLAISVFVALLITGSASGAELCGMSCALAGFGQGHHRETRSKHPASLGEQHLHHHYELQHESNADTMWNPQHAFYSNRCVAQTHSLTFVPSSRVQLNRNTAHDSILQILSPDLPGSTFIPKALFPSKFGSPPRIPVVQATPIRI